MVDPVVAGQGSKVLWCDTATSHGVDEVIRWTTDACYVVMLFLTPFEAETVNGREIGQAGQMLINPPRTLQWHRGVAGKGFTNDWIHLAEDAVRKPIEQADLPLNRIFSVSNTWFLAQIIHDIQADALLNAPHHNEMEACKVTELILLTGRYYRMAQRMAISPVEHSHYERLCSIRRKLREEFTTPWRVETMAAMAHLSPNRFAKLYRKFFHVSPVQDVIDTRLAEAGLLLRQGELTVSEVANRCGFGNLNYFSRLFKARTGRTPGQYRG